MVQTPALFLFSAAVVVGAALNAQDAKTAWLQEHAIPIATLERADGDAFADLAPLAEHIGDARIVMLGEQTHGDGAAFHAKTRLIAFLHERMGFDVLCFESGIFECGEAWRAMAAGTHAREAMETAVFPIWMQSQQVAPLVTYLEQRARSDRPLELCGYDCQLTGRARAALPAVLEQIAVAVEPEDRAAEALALLRAGFDSVAGGEPMSEASRLKMEKTVAALRDDTRRVDVDRAKRGEYAILLESLCGFSAAHAAGGDDRASLAEKFNPRDAQGGRNMIWLAKDKFADRKIIVWAASMHLVRHHSDIDTGPMSRLDYRGVRSMGDHAAEELGEDVFVISCTTHAGEAGLPWGKSWAVQPAPRGSFEDLCAQAGLTNAVVPLRGISEGTFLSEACVARPLGNSPMRAIWPRHVDAFVFQRTMTPSTQFRTETERKRAADLIGALQAEAARYRQRREQRHAYADKGELSSKWDEWVQVAQPDDAARAAMERRIGAWAETVRDDAAVSWRVSALLGYIAHERGDHDGAIRKFDAALAAYQPLPQAEPSRQSARQHLVNRRAFALWDRDGFEAAVGWAADCLQRDLELFYFHPHPWLERLADDSAKRAKLLAAVEVAFEKRVAMGGPHVRQMGDYLGVIRQVFADG